MTTDTHKLNRRQFLILAGATGVVAIPTLLGYDLLRDANGESPPNLSPYAPVDVLESWPSDPAQASPILLLIDEGAENPFGTFLTEILRAEGLNLFQVARLSALASAPLDWFDLVLLAEGRVNSVQADLLEGYVARGGRLVSMRPDVRLAHLFGVERVAGNTTEGYLQVEAGHPVGQGIVTETLQFHGVADHYRLAGAQAIAWLANDADTLTDFPAVTLYHYGQGQAALWAFDLARSVAYTRQGNPDWADQERDELDGVRACDMFKGWVDLDRLAIPQADEQQRLLVNLLAALSQEARPLPRIWYFPSAAEGVFVATADSHIDPASAVEDLLTRVEQWGGHASVYYAPPLSKDWYRAARNVKRWAEGLPIVGQTLVEPGILPGPAHVADWRARGHEFALHPYVDEGLDLGWRTYWREFTGMGYGPVSPTVRTHRILWTGWVETARTQAAMGMRMNLDYYHIGPTFQSEGGEWVYGHFTGSGLPMKFVDEQGRILNIYQQLTQLADEHLLAALPWVPEESPKLTAEDAVEVSQELFRRSLDGAYSAIVAQFHMDPFSNGGQQAAEVGRWLDGTLNFAATQEIPIWSALDWLQFTEVRHDADLEDVEWNTSTRSLSFRLAAKSAPDIELTVLIPMGHGGTRLVAVEIDGKPMAYKTRKVGGVEYAWALIEAGIHTYLASYV